MKFNEFRSRVEALNTHYKVAGSIGSLFVSVLYKNILIISIKEKEQFDILHNLKASLPFSQKVYMLAAEYAVTPIDERHEEKKYYLALKKSFPNVFIDADGNIMKCLLFESPKHFQVTQNEIDQLNESFSFDLNDIKLAVKDDE